MNEDKKKKRFKMPTSYTVLFLIIIVLAILTWIIPAGRYDTVGNWTSEIPVSLKAGDVLKLKFEPTGGDTSSQEVTLTVGDTDPVTSGEITINPVAVDDTEISGDAAPGDSVSITWPDNSNSVAISEDTGDYIGGTYHSTEQSPQGFWEVAMAPINGMLGTDSTGGAIEVSLFVLIIGGFLGVVTKTGAIDAGIGAVVKANKGREKLLIPILMAIFALGGTTYGMAEETMAFYPLLIPVMIAAGFDTMTAVSIILIGAGVGVLGSTVNPFATGVASQAVGLSPGDGIIWRLLILALSLGVGIWFVYRYASKVEKDPSKSMVAENWEDDKKHFALSEEAGNGLSGKQKWVLIIFGVTFVIMIASLVPWDMIIPGFDFFINVNDWIHSIPIIGNLVGQDSLPLGSWYFREITMLFLVMAIVIGFVSRQKETVFIDSFIDGARDLLGVAFIIGLARGIQVIMNDGQMTATVLYWGSQALQGLPAAAFGVLTYVFYIPMSFLIPSTSGLASATMTIMGPLGTFVGVDPSVVITAFQSASGIVNLITPTSAVVMGALAIGRIEYGKWLKFTWPLLVILFVISAVVIAAASIFSGVI
ncbi:YfcC family protein [Culicoidibacter larvae]|uniref:YfcC family protein n=1 Tax=Culicoidibacter larvae TaxID=2579976 RepID=A0A5R8QCL1_9FIRM|nr:YfcC family protein [Culicoidibacter larvae]TLG74265.1 YfcC family protein [Culicoidibacter larvae]